MDRLVSALSPPSVNSTQPSRLRAHARAWLDHLNDWRQRARSRQHLARLNERQLADLGISLAERSAEIEKPFWR